MKKIVLFLCSVFLITQVIAQTQPLSKETITQALKESNSQYLFLKNRLNAIEKKDRFPQSYDKHTERLKTSNSEWWCSGFYPGTLFYLYEETHDEALYNEALRMLQLLEKEQYNKDTHDLGFMMFCSFGNANRINPKPEYREILINSAKSLCSRFNPQVGCIKSWDSSNKNDFLVIIDNMMNLELLFWATEATGDSTYYNIAVTHANTTLKNHFRADNSSYHLVNYNPQTGEVQQKKTAQGYQDSSAWARGQAWGLYGYTLMYRVTKDKKYLDQAVKIAEYTLNNPNLPQDKIPYWDYNAPNILDALRDASAGAINCSALLELGQYVDDKTAGKYFSMAKIMLESLTSDKYRAKQNTNGGFILEHSVGHIPAGTEVDVPLTYADYYYIEALKRYSSTK